MDKKLMLYPFGKKTCAVARYNQLLKGYVLASVVSPKNYGYDGKDVSFVDGGDFVGITITSSFYEEITQCDSILFSASTFSTDLSYYEEKIQYAFNCKKEVLFTKDLAEDFIRDKRSIPSGVKLLGNNPLDKKFSYNEITYIREIDVPVMTIFQVGEFCHGFDTQLLMTERFEEEGYQVSCVSSRDLAELFNMHTLPNYIYDPHIPYEDKIISFNYFLLSIVETEQPDILLLEIEEAILPYNDRITNHFGVIPTIITNAVQADVSILNLYYSIYEKSYLNNLKDFCRYALNAEISYINIANTSMVVKEIDSINPIHYISVDRDMILHNIDSNYNNYDCMFFHTYDLNSVDAAYDNIVSKLSQNKDTVRIW